MLKNMPRVISPDLLKVLAEMGKGDAIAIGNGNFPSATAAKNSMLIHCDGASVAELVDGILTLIPLDESISDPVLIMDKDSRAEEEECPIWDEIRAIVAKHDERGSGICSVIPQGRFYTMAVNACCVVATSDPAVCGCVILQKGTI